MKNTILLLIFTFISNSLLSQVFVSEGTSLNLKNGVDFSLTGNFENNGKVAGTGFLNISGGKSQSISGNGVLENLSVNKSGGQVEVTTGNQDIIKIFVIHSGSLIPNGKLTLKSSDTLTAQIGQNTGGFITGDFIIERYIPKSNRAYRYFSSPVSTSESILMNLQEGQNNQGTNYPADNINDKPGFGTHITGSTTGADGFDATLTGNPSMFSWDAAPQSWSSIGNTDIKTLEKGEPFALLIRGSRAASLNSNTAIGPATTLRLTGNPTILDFTKQVDLIEDNSFVLLGNPYHAAIDANLVLQNNTGLNNNFIYVYDPTLNTQGGYATVELTGGTNQQDSDANQFIQPWQSVFVEVTNIGATTLNLSFSESNKDVSQPQVATFSTPTRINLKLQSENKTIDAVSLKLEHGANSEVDGKDAKKFWNYDENISIYSQERYLSIEERAFPQSLDTVMLHTYQKRKDNYKLILNSSNLSQTEIVLKDFYLDKEYTLEPNQDLIIDYQVAEGEPDLRFGFIIGAETLNTEEFTSKNFQVYPNPAKDVLNIEILNSSYQNLKFEIYSLLGQKVAEADFKNQNKVSNFDISSFPTGVYLVVITDNKSLKETLKFVKI
ncbi:T9SS type A sorting domain-containing protein [Psychroflexus salinarum]|uniref:T9SS type A sorting domain-containing protein n=1 Tax=Psychroflexus salinarum TaxID=546024 RepID=A0ABW3GSK0_9FLAO